MNLARLTAGLRGRRFRTPLIHAGFYPGTRPEDPFERPVNTGYMTIHRDPLTGQLYGVVNPRKERTR